MILSVETGKKEPMFFKNDKVEVKGSEGIYHTGIIEFDSNNKIKVESSVRHSDNVAQNSNCNQISSAAQTTNESTQVNKVEHSRLGIDNQNSKVLNSGQKLSLLDIGIEDNTLIIGIDLKFKGNPFDVDFSAFLIDNNGKSTDENFIFYGNKNSKQNEVILDSDMNTGIIKGFDSCMAVNLAKASADVSRISFTATLYDESKTFSQLEKGVLSVITSSKKEVLKYEFTEKLNTENAIVICDLYLHNGQWKLQGIGQGFNGGLAALCGNFGIETE